jgi:hypothetical protein
MLFGGKKHTITNDINITIDNKRLDITNSTKFLGVILDSKISWKDHILHLSKKIARSIGILTIARKVLDQKSLITLYYSLIYPYLTYCILIWGNSPAQTIWPIYRLQKIAIRIIANLRKRNSSIPFCKKHKILRLPEIYSLYTGIFIFKVKNSLLPEIYNGLFNQNNAYHNYPTRNSKKLRIPKVRTQLAENFITKTGVNIWNNLHEDLQNNRKIGSFKRKLKDQLLENY